MRFEIQSDILDSKIDQYKLFHYLVRTPKYRVFRNVMHFICNFASLKYEFGKYVVTSEFGDGGKTFMLVDEHTKASDIFKLYDSNNRIRITEYLYPVESYSIHSVISKKDIVLSPIVEQIIEDKFLFRGAKFPCKQLTEIYEYTDVLSREIQKLGYRGICHFDFMYHNDKVYFGEINPRFARSTPFVSYTMNNSLFKLHKMAKNGENLPLPSCRNISWVIRVNKDKKIEFSKET